MYMYMYVAFKCFVNLLLLSWFTNFRQIDYPSLLVYCMLCLNYEVISLRTTHVHSMRPTVKQFIPFISHTFNMYSSYHPLLPPSPSLPSLLPLSLPPPLPLPPLPPPSPSPLPPPQTISIIEQRLTMTENKLKECLDYQQRVTLQIRPDDQIMTRLQPSSGYYTILFLSYLNLLLLYLHKRM